MADPATWPPHTSAIAHLVCQSPRLSHTATITGVAHISRSSTWLPGNSAQLGCWTTQPPLNSATAQLGCRTPQWLLNLAAAHLSLCTTQPLNHPPMPLLSGRRGWGATSQGWRSNLGGLFLQISLRGQIIACLTSQLGCCSPLPPCTPAAMKLGWYSTWYSIGDTEQPTYIPLCTHDKDRLYRYIISKWGLNFGLGGVCPKGNVKKS